MFDSLWSRSKYATKVSVLRSDKDKICFSETCTSKMMSLIFINTRITNLWLNASARQASCYEAMNNRRNIFGRILWHADQFILASKGTFVGVLEISLSHEWDGLTHVRMCRPIVNVNVKYQRMKRQDAFFSFGKMGGKASTLLSLNRIEVWIESTFTPDTLLKIHKALI